mmetsp:Transcript_70373/g.203997  ORF Transcript_70373/g.203997 Transcript_70373/m.203997 type:complete len:340 (-) Transcript_70373:144-1163(-)
MAMMQQTMTHTVQEMDVTTVMFRNLPRRYTAYDLLGEISLYIDQKLVDFVYLPWDSQAHNMGYAFVNFTQPGALNTVYRAMSGALWRLSESTRRIKILPASVHGLAANLAHCEPRISPSPNKPVYPIVFVNGEEIDFHEAIRLMRAGLLPTAGRSSSMASAATQPPPSPQPPHCAREASAKSQAQPKRTLPRLSPAHTTPFWSSSTRASETAEGLEFTASRSSMDLDIAYEVPSGRPGHAAVTPRIPTQPTQISRSMAAFAAAAATPASATAWGAKTSSQRQQSPPMRGISPSDLQHIDMASEERRRCAAMLTPGYERAWYDVHQRLVELMRRIAPTEE